MSPAGGLDASSCAGPATGRELDVYMDNQENEHAQTAALSQYADMVPFAALRLGRYSAELKNANAQATVLGQPAPREPLRVLPLTKHPADQDCALAQTGALRQHADRAFALPALPQGRPQAGQRPRLKHPGNLNLTRKLGAPARKPARVSDRAPEPSLLSTEASQAAKAPEMSKGAGTGRQQSRPAVRGGCDSAGPPQISTVTESASQHSRPSSGEVELTRQPPLSSSSRPNQQQQPARLGSVQRTVDSTSEVSPEPPPYHQCMLMPPCSCQERSLLCLRTLGAACLTQVSAWPINVSQVTCAAAVPHSTWLAGSDGDLRPAWGRSASKKRGISWEACSRQEEPQEQHLAGDGHQRPQELQLCPQGVSTDVLACGLLSAAPRAT